MAADVNLLAEVPLFQLLDDDERATLAGLLDVRSFSKGETVFNYGDAGDALYIVRRGSVQVFVEDCTGETIILSENLTGDVFGEISLLDGGPRTATAVAIDETEALVMNRGDLLDLITRHPHAAMDLLSVMGRRLRSTDELLRTHVSRNLNVEEEERLTLGQRIADHVASFGGSWSFIITFGVVLLGWIAVNVYLAVRGAQHGLSPEKAAFDPYPFILLNLFLSMLAALQAPVIMMSQNRQAAKDRLKGDLDYEVNLKAELEVAQLHRKVDRVYEELQANFARLHRTNGPHADNHRETKV
jgi:CRP/FNR family transcriptional regulator, cyclic AMP receptor protein